MLSLPLTDNHISKNNHMVTETFGKGQHCINGGAFTLSEIILTVSHFSMISYHFTISLHNQRNPPAMNIKPHSYRTLRYESWFIVEQAMTYRWSVWNPGKLWSELANQLLDYQVCLNNSFFINLNVYIFLYCFVVFFQNCKKNIWRVNEMKWKSILSVRQSVLFLLF